MASSVLLSENKIARTNLSFDSLCIILFCKTISSSFQNLLIWGLSENRYLYLSGDYLLKIITENIRKICEIFSKLTIKTSEWLQKNCSGVSIFDFEQKDSSWVEGQGLMVYKFLKSVRFHNAYQLFRRIFWYIENRKNLSKKLCRYTNPEKNSQTCQCVKSVRIRSFYSPCFPICWLSTDGYGVSLCIHFESRKIWARKTPNTDSFHPV